MENANKTFDQIQGALQDVASQERALLMIETLALEYQARTIGAQRFADRVVEILRTLQADRLHSSTTEGKR